MCGVRSESGFGDGYGVGSEMENERQRSGEWHEHCGGLE